MERKEILKYVEVDQQRGEKRVRERELVTERELQMVTMC